MNVNLMKTKKFQLLQKQADFISSIMSSMVERDADGNETPYFDFDFIVPRLKKLECDNLEILVLEGVDHDFAGKVDDFIALIDLI